METSIEGFNIIALLIAIIIIYLLACIIREQETNTFMSMRVVPKSQYPNYLDYPSPY